MQGNVFNENVEYLYQVQTDLEAVESLKKELAEYRNQEKTLKKAIASEEKSIKDEINQTIKKRKNQIEKEYDNQIDSNKSKARSVQGKREKTKSKRVDERVSYETSDLVEENRQLQVELKTLFKAQHVPSFCRSQAFYTMFMTKGLKEVLTMIVSMIALFAGLPAIIYLLSTHVFYKGNDHVTALSTATVVATVVVLFAIYIAIMNFVKLKHHDTLKEGRQIKDEIDANKRQMKAIRNKINQDKDDSQYGLEKYDRKLEDLEFELEQISADKKEAMTVFENETKQLLTDEVNDRRLGKLEELKANLEAVEERIALVDEDVKNSSLAIANNYGAILGKDFCTSSKVQDLISLMEDGTADTVSEAIDAYRGAGR